MSIACDICFEFYSDKYATRVPRVLPRCGHDFCTECVDILCAVDIPTCPKCRVNVRSVRKSQTPNSCTESEEVHQSLSSADFPVLRCLLEVEDRIDLRNGLSPILVQKALQRAPTELLEIELNHRRQLGLLQNVPLDVLQEELRLRTQQRSDAKKRKANGALCTSRPPEAGHMDLGIRTSALEAFAVQAVATARASTLSSLRNGFSNESSFRRTSSSGVHQLPQAARGGGEMTGSPTVPLMGFRSLGLCEGGAAAMTAYHVPRLLHQRYRPYNSMAVSGLLKLFEILRHLCVGNAVYLLQQWHSIDRGQRLQLLMVVQALPLLAVAIYVNFASLF